MSERARSAATARLNAQALAYSRQQQQRSANDRRQSLNESRDDDRRLDVSRTRQQQAADNRRQRLEDSRRIPHRFPGPGDRDPRPSDMNRGHGIPESQLAGHDVDTDMRFATDAELEAYIRANYGYMAAFLDNSEVRTVLFDSARGGWDESRMYGAISATNWWQTTSAAQRTYQRLVSEDPAEATRMVQQTAADIYNRVSSLGIPIDGAQLTQLATDAVSNGWTDAQVIDQILDGTSWSDVQGGDLTASRDAVAEIASNYLVGVSEDTAQDYAKRIASGEMTMDGVRSIMAQQAKSRFGYMSDAIDQGATVRDYFAPIQNVIATELELAPDAINLMSPEWMGMIEQRDDDGNLRAATMHEAQLSARKRPEWARTSRAQETGTGLVNLVSDIFGRSGT